MGHESCSRPVTPGSLEPLTKCRRLLPPVGTGSEHNFGIDIWEGRMDDTVKPPLKKSRTCFGRPVDDREPTIRKAAETVVRFLHDSSSVDDALQRGVRALNEFEAEVRHAAAHDISGEVPDSEVFGGEERPAAPSAPQVTNKVLMRAVHHLAERCRRLDAGASEVESLRQELEQSRETQQRLAHSNEVLQEHLKIHLNRCRCGGV